jgi:hypothetical protein
MSSKQNYSNHRKYYVPHHFVFYPLSFALIIVSIHFAGENADKRDEWHMIAALIFLVAWLSFMIRQHYAIVPQNRIIRLEMRLRYFQLTGKRFEPVEEHLSFSQIAALRFASDDELIPLIEKAVKENLKGSEIKKMIIHWQPDHMRV